MSKSIGIEHLPDNKVKVTETTLNGDARTINEYILTRDLYLSNLMRDRATLTQQIAEAQTLLTLINQTLDNLNGVNPDNR